MTRLPEGWKGTERLARRSGGGCLDSASKMCAGTAEMSVGTKAEADAVEQGGSCCTKLVEGNSNWKTVQRLVEQALQYGEGMSGLQATRQAAA